MALYYTVCFLEFVLDLRTVKKTPGGMSGEVSVCVRAVCMLTMQTIRDAVSVYSTLYQERLACIAFTSAL